MNCRDSQSLLDELARNQMMDAGQRQSVLAHVASCGNCARSLEDARALTSGLRYVAAMDAHNEASPRVEASLISAFREHHSGSHRVSVSAAVTTRRWFYIAAAAVIAILISIIASRNQNSGTSAPQEAQSTQELPARSESPKPAPPSPQRRLVAVNHKSNARPVKQAVSSKPVPPDSNRPGGELEIATDFFPLVNREALNQLDSGQLVRVELPRSALMSFGLPMNMERANERVKADVVVGQDGLARAIRFVR